MEESVATTTTPCSGTKRSMVSPSPSKLSKTVAKTCPSTPHGSLGVRVGFEIDYECLPPNQVYVVGSIPQLGNWDTTRAKLMVSKSDQSSEGRNKFYLDICLSDVKDFDYKYIVLDENTGERVWESGINRRQMQGNDSTTQQSLDMWQSPRNHSLNNVLRRSSAMQETVVVEGSSSELEMHAKTPTTPKFSGTPSRLAGTPNPSPGVTGRPGLAQLASPIQIHQDLVTRKKVEDQRLAELASIRNQVEIMEAEHRKEMAAKMALLSEKQEFEKKLQEEKTKFEQQRDEVVRLERCKEAEIAKFKSQIDNLRKENGEIEIAKSRAEEKCSTLENQQLEAEESLKSTEEKLRVLESSLANVQGQFANRSEKVKRMKLQVSMFKGNLKRIQGDVAGMAAEFQESMQHVSKAVTSSLLSMDKDLLDTRQLYLKESAERKQIFNELQDMRGNIRVFCRVRPLSSEEEAQHERAVISTDDDRSLSVTHPESLATKKFDFDRVFSPESTQSEVAHEAEALTASVLDGYNVCIFAYGQTGSGKTYTMAGPEHDRGLNYRALDQLFRLINERSSQYSYMVRFSMLEIYNEQIRDLLDANEKKLEIRQGLDGNYVPDLTHFPVSSMNEVWEAMGVGDRNRATEATNSNAHSSRSHSILTISIVGKSFVSGATITGKLNLIDLAGSERVSKSEATGMRLREAQHINKSLSALGDVMSSLVSKGAHIPYRNSKLTYLLQDSLGGDSKVLMVVQCSPVTSSHGETLCSLNFASRVKKITLGPAKRNVDNGDLIRTKEQMAKLKETLQQKDLELEKLRLNVRNVEDQAKSKGDVARQLNDKIKALERLNRQHEETNKKLEKRIETLTQQNHNLTQRAKHSTLPVVNSKMTTTAHDSTCDAPPFEEKRNTLKSVTPKKVTGKRKEMVTSDPNGSQKENPVQKVKICEDSPVQHSFCSDSPPQSSALTPRRSARTATFSAPSRATRSLTQATVASAARSRVLTSTGMRRPPERVLTSDKGNKLRKFRF